MMQASAIERSLTDQLSGGLGFTAVITTWLARLSPPVIVAVSFLFSMLIQGGSFLQSAMKIPASVASILVITSYSIHYTKLYEVMFIFLLVRSMLGYVQVPAYAEPVDQVGGEGRPGQGPQLAQNPAPFR